MWATAFILPNRAVALMSFLTFAYHSKPTIFQRTSVSRGQLRIQGVATCLYLCMDSCGLLYGSVSQAVYEKKLLYLSIKSPRSTPPTDGLGIPRERKPSGRVPRDVHRFLSTSSYSVIRYRDHLNYRNAAGKRESTVRDGFRSTDDGFVAAASSFLRTEAHLRGINSMNRIRRLTAIELKIKLYGKIDIDPTGNAVTIRVGNTETKLQYRLEKIDDEVSISIKYRNEVITTGDVPRYWVLRGTKRTRKGINEARIKEAMYS
ncbi:Fibroblast growth factor like protein [Eufriesea mexicana]|nr:Fibroblast growth factor like protein [Eufriesea mexicana]